MTTSVQTSYSDDLAIGIAGQLADVGPHDVVSANNSNATGIVAGCLAFRSGDRLCRPILSTDEPALDDDSIIASGVASTTTAQIITSASYNGVVGALVFAAVNLVYTFNSHADWDATTMVVEGLGAFGEVTEETIEIPNGGNVVITGTVPFTQVTAVRIPIQSGTNGTLKIGTGVKLGALNARAAGVAVYNSMREPGTFAQYEAVSLLKRGRVKVLTEGVVTAGGPVYVRVIATTEQRGAFAGSPSANHARLDGATWESTTTGSAIAVLNLNLPS